MVPVMIDKNYFRRQARTLRKMVKVAQDKTVADRLSDMAADFEARAMEGSEGFGRVPPHRRGTDGEEGLG